MPRYQKRNGPRDRPELLAALGAYRNVLNAEMASMKAMGSAGVGAAEHSISAVPAGLRALAGSGAVRHDDGEFWSILGYQHVCGVPPKTSRV